MTPGTRKCRATPPIAVVFLAVVVKYTYITQFGRCPGPTGRRGGTAARGRARDAGWAAGRRACSPAVTPARAPHSSLRSAPPEEAWAPSPAAACALASVLKPSYLWRRRERKKGQTHTGGWGQSRSGGPSAEWRRGPAAEPQCPQHRFSRARPCSGSCVGHVSSFQGRRAAEVSTAESLGPVTLRSSCSGAHISYQDYHMLLLTFPIVPGLPHVIAAAGVSRTTRSASRIHRQNRTGGFVNQVVR